MKPRTWINGTEYEYTGKTETKYGAVWYIVRDRCVGVETATQRPPYIGPAVPDFYFRNGLLTVR